MTSYFSSVPAQNEGRSYIKPEMGLDKTPDTNRMPNPSPKLLNFFRRFRPKPKTKTGFAAHSPLSTGAGPIRVVRFPAVL